ncbi:MAG: NAD-dependent epimerase/dehydratase family protein [Fervidobacterium sp.]|nr:NAD-dependent epimerase/dehydratase family protein [Fervidobacterium sp.]
MILVTGATGHLGNVLVRELIKKGYHVRVLVHPKDDLIPLQLLPIEILYGDINDDFSHGLKGVESVFHLASLISITPGKRKQIYKTNVDGTINVINLCKKYKIPLIYVSSVHAIAEVPKGSTINEDIPVDEEKVRGHYAKSKAIATKKVMEAFKEGLNGYIIFPTGICGPFDYRLSYFSRVLIKYKYNKLKIAVIGGFDFVDVRDVVYALLNLHHLFTLKHYVINHQRYLVSANKVRFELLPLVCGMKKYVVCSDYTAYLVSYLSLLAQLIFGVSTEFVPYALHTINLNYTYSSDKLKETIEYHPRKFEKSVEDFFKWLSEDTFLQKHGTVDSKFKNR